MLHDNMWLGLCNPAELYMTLYNTTQPYATICHGSVEDVYGFLQTDGFRRCASLFSSIVTLKGGLSRWLPSSSGPCRVY